MTGDKLTYRNQLEQYLERLQAGESDLAIQKALDLTSDSYSRIKDLALRCEVDRLGKTTTEQVYVEYCLAQRGCIADLSNLLDQYREAKNASAIVGAVKARSDILDKMIKLGQDFGFIEKKPEEKRLVAGVVITQLSNDQLRAAITDQISSLNTLVTQYGDKKLIDVDPGDLYREAPAANVIEAKLEPKPPPAEPTLAVEEPPAPAVEEPPSPPPPPSTQRAGGRKPVAPPPPPATPGPQEPGPPFYEPCPPPAPVETTKRNRAQSNRRYGGRRVVKKTVR